MNVNGFRGEYAFLSNMYPTDVHMTINGQRFCFKSSESAYQALKNPSCAFRFVGLSGPDAKRLGRKIDLRPDWDAVKDDVMLSVINAKFDSNLFLRNKLGEIDGDIIEANTWGDRYWGQVNGVGENKLGKILMQKRDEIQKEKTEPYVRNKGNSIVSVPDDYIVLDLETTGFDSRHDRIIELSALKCYKGSVVDTFSTLVYPEKTIPQNIEQLTGISNDMVKDAPVIQDVLPQFQIFACNYPIVGYGVNFDINFVYDNVKKYQHVDFNNDYIDVMGIAQKVHGHKQKLTALAEAYGVNTNSAHRALNDCMMCNECFKILQKDMDKLSAKTVTQADNARVTISDANSEFNGKSFKRSFGSYVFTDDDIKHLVAGEEITIKDFKTKRGDVIGLRGRLGDCSLPNGRTYFGFKRTDIDRRNVPTVNDQPDDDMQLSS